jgi:hypothetical protein
VAAKSTKRFLEKSAAKKEKYTFKKV